jgi:hypothetical protein
VRKKPISDIRDIATQFRLGGQFISADRYGHGHINDTYIVEVDIKGGTARYILQRINEHVFRDPASLMDNVRRVTEHLASKSDDARGNGFLYMDVLMSRWTGRPRATSREFLTLVSTQGGASLYRDGDGGYWRAYPFIDGAITCDEVTSRSQAREAAAIFGRFQHQLGDLPAPRLHETIPDFHNTPARYRQLHEALQQDAYDRAKHCGPEIEWALANERAAGTLLALQEAGDIPERIAHNDTKLNNVMFDEQSGKALCVIDLDTVMPGLVLYDFGDLVRTATTPTAEDETDLSKIGMRMEYFAALVEGYLSTAMSFLTDAEIENLAVSGKVITIETGLRFLTDYLSGDEYFRTQRTDQNLDRCRAQFALAASIDQQLGEMQQFVASVASAIRSKQQAGPA